MKRKFILLPITLTALAPTIGMVGCNKPESQYHSVKVDSSSDTANIIIYDAEITLNKQLVISYQMMSATKELDVDNSWVKFDSSSQFPLSNPEFRHDNNRVIIPADKVTTYDITICLVSKEKTPEPEETKFTTTTGAMSSATEATFQLDWENGHSLTFATNWKFTTNAGEVESITTTGGGTRPQIVSITFSNEIATDIADGKLTFTYNDLTTEKDNISTTIKNICITKYTPEYEDIGLSFRQGGFYSSYRNCDINKKYHLYAKGFFWDGTTRLRGQDKNGSTILNMDVSIEKLLVNGENCDYEVGQADYIMSFELIGTHKDIDIYLIFNKTYDDMCFRLS